MNDIKHEMTNKASHTKGPWNEGYRGSRGEYIGTLDRIVCQVATSGNRDEDDANALLLAAAPELLAFAFNVRAACAVQANLNSTASEADRSRFISDVFRLWNTEGIAATDRATGKGVAS